MTRSIPGDSSAAPSYSGTEHDVVVVGGGQAGLAIGYFLAQRGLRFTILEAADQPAAAWRERWDSLELFTPARYSALPGWPFPGDPWHHPGRDEVVAYLSDYSERFRLPIELGRRVTSVSKQENDYHVEAADRSYRAEQIVIATGPFQAPYVPSFAAGLDPGVTQLHSTAYRRPPDVPPGTVLVVGGGNTGYQIAHELSASRDVHLSVGSRQAPLPQRIAGRDLFWYLEATGLMRKSLETRIGRRFQGRETLVGSSPRSLRRRGVRLRERAVDAAGRTVKFADGGSLDCDAVVWATGFRADHTWIDVPVFDEAGRVVQKRGVTRSPGLYFLGLTWMHTRGSALIGWVEDDAAYLARRIDEFRQAGASASRAPARSL